MDRIVYETEEIHLLSIHALVHWHVRRGSADGAVLRFYPETVDCGAGNDIAFPIIHGIGHPDEGRKEVRHSEGLKSAFIDPIFACTYQNAAGSFWWTRRES